MTQLVKLIINGTSYTSQMISCNLSFGIGRVFNTGTILLAGTMPSIIKGGEVELTHGDNIFNGFVFSYTKASNNTYNIAIRSNGGKLTEPFFTDIDGVASATTATELCAEYALESGCSITYNAIELEFGGSWAESGTPDTELVKLATVTGGEIYDDGNGVIIEPPKPSSGVPIIISPSDVIDFSIDGDTIMNNRLGIVIIADSTSSSSVSNGDIIADNSMSMELNNCTGEIEVYPSPFGSLDSYEGAVIVRVDQYKELTERKMMNHEFSFTLNGAISSIISASINGVPISHHHYQNNTNLVYFDTPQSGELTVKYKTKYHLLTTKSTSTALGNFASFEIIKGNSYLKWAGFLKCDNDDDDKDGIVTPEFSYRVIDSNHVTGAEIYTYGETPELTLYSDGEKIPLVGKLASTEDCFIMNEDVTLSKLEDGSYSAYLNSPSCSIASVKSSGSPISFTEETDSSGNEYIGLTQFYPNVSVQYEAEGILHEIQYANIPNAEQVLVLESVGSIYEIPLEGTDNDEWDDPSLFPCGYPADFPFNIATLLGMELKDVVGKTIPNMGTVDNDGYVFVNYTQDGIYVYDTSVIMPLTSITLRANSNGSLTNDN